MRCLKILSGCCAILVAMPGGASAADAADVAAPLRTLRAVGNDGSNSEAAAAAWDALSQQPASQLPVMLRALDDAGPIAANWIRGAIDAVAAREIEQPGGLPIAELEAIVVDRTHQPRARRIAFEWLTRADTTAADRLVPNMLDDPGLEFRRDAVARILSSAEKIPADNPRDQRLALYRQALNGARDEDQIKTIAERLAGLGQTVDLAQHFGFLRDWQVIGPFDNADRQGFAAVFPPEEKIDLKATYAGKDPNRMVQWTELRSREEYGKVDLNPLYDNAKQAVAYAWTEFRSSSAQDLELRLSCKNAWKVWLNGELLFEREEYHRGTQFDQYQLKAHMRPGSNEILVKVCQNEETQPWTVEWQFQLRVCDALGTAVYSQPVTGDRNE